MSTTRTAAGRFYNDTMRPLPPQMRWARFVTEPEQVEQAQPATGTPTDEPPLGDAGKRALTAERDARKAAEDATKALQAELADLKGNLAQIFGGKPDAGADGTALVQQLQQQVEQMRHEQEVLALANKHKITDEADLALLRAATVPDARESLAARLAPTASDETRSPKPDLTQGPKGEPVRAESLPGVPRLAQAFDDAMNSNRK